MKAKIPPTQFIIMLLISAFIFISKVNYAQNYLMKSNSNVYEPCKALAPIDSNHIILVSENSSGSEKYLKKINTNNGDIIWCKKFSNTIGLRAILVLNNNTFIVSGNCARYDSLTNTNVQGNAFLHFDENGDTIKTNAFESVGFTNSFNVKMFIKPDGGIGYSCLRYGIVEFGNIDITSLTITPVAAYPLNGSYDIMDIKIINGNIVVLTNYYEIYVLTNNFNVIDHKKIEGTGIGSLGLNALRIFNDIDNNYIITGSLNEVFGVFIKLSSTFAILQQKRIGLINNVSIADVVKDADDNFYTFGFFGNVMDDSTWDAMLLKLNTNGDTIATKYFGVNGTNDNLKIGVMMPNGSIWAVGSSTTLGKQFFLKTDVNLSVGCNALIKSSGVLTLPTISINNYSSANSTLLTYDQRNIVASIIDYSNSSILICGTPTEIEETEPNENEFNLYPNPTKGKLNISVNKNISRITVYDIVGNAILQMNHPSNSIDLSPVPNGIYIIEIAYIYGNVERKRIHKL